MRYDLSGNMLASQIADPVVVVEPTQPPVTLEELKAHLRQDIDDEDALITSLGIAARQWVEKETGLAIVDQTLELRLDGYPASRAIALRGPLLGSVSFSYTDSNGDLQVIDDDQYIVDASAKNRAPRIVPAYNATWPTATPVSDSLRIRWRAGFVDLTGSPIESMSLVPETLKSAIKLHVEAHFDRDERTFGMLIKAAESLCSTYRVVFGIA